MLYSTCLKYLWNYTGKSDEDDEEGTISRPSSPKGGEEEAKVDTADPPDNAAREKSATSVRIGNTLS